MVFISRIVKVKGYDRVLIGRDVGDALSEGIVYGITNFNGIITLTPIGEAVIPMKGIGIGAVMVEGANYLTKLEYKDQLKREGFDEDQIEKFINGLR